MPSPLKAIRRLVTGHTHTGKSTFIIDDNLVSFAWRGNERRRATRLWVSEHSPADTNNLRMDMKDVVPDREIVASNGTHCICMEIAPGESSPVHRTNSLDYMILISGQVTLVLDDGEERTVTEPGSIIVQRGTMHTWVNRSNTWARYVIIVIDALPTTVRAPNGSQKTLPEGIKSS